MRTSWLCLCGALLLLCCVKLSDGYKRKHFLPLHVAVINSLWSALLHAARTCMRKPEVWEWELTPHTMPFVSAAAERAGPCHKTHTRFFYCLDFIAVVVAAAVPRGTPQKAPG
jgi:hypothetical protein